MPGDRPDREETARRVSGSRTLPDGRRGRGATANPEGRFEPFRRDAFDDGWNRDDDPQSARTDVVPEHPKSLITYNTSPDIGFDRSINPFKGCEHGCIYCFARPNHAYLGLSPGLDFETKLFSKPDAAAILERDLSAPSYKPRTIALGTATDPYQPIERRLGTTRAILDVLARCRHPVGIVTKSNLIERDADILGAMARDGLVKVAISVTTLDAGLARRLEPRAPHPAKRLAAIRRLAEAGVPVMAIMAPIIPSLNDHEIEALLAAARDEGASEASYVLLRLPHELDALVGEWLSEHYPGRKAHIYSLLTQSRGGKTYDSTFGMRMIGQGPYADLIKRRFALAKQRLGYPATRYRVRTDLFRKPGPAGQMTLL